MFAYLAGACFLIGVALGAIAGLGFAYASSQPKRDSLGRFTKKP